MTALIIAYAEVNSSFWDNPPPRKPQECFQEGEDWATLRAVHSWQDPNGKELMKGRIAVRLRPLEGGELFVDFVLRFEPAGEPVTLGKTQFGFLAVRVARSMTVDDGGGVITNSEGPTDWVWPAEPRRARWMDYSGPVSPSEWNGIAFFDHPSNPRYPTYWSVNSDGWMGTAFCHNDPFRLEVGESLVLRHRLYVHRGRCDPRAIERQHEQFAHSDMKD